MGPAPMADETDFRILGSIYGDPFASYENIGRKVGLTGTAVKARIDALKRSGVLDDFYGLPAASLFRRHARIYRFPVGALDRERLSEVIRLDPVVFAGMHHDNVFGVLAYIERPGDLPPPELVEALGQPTMTVTPLIPAPKDPAYVPSSAEFRLLRSLIGTPRATPAELGRRTGLSQRTIRRNREHLVEAGVLQVSPYLQAARSRGMVFFMAFIYFSKGAKVTTVESEFLGSIRMGSLENPPGEVRFCRAGSLAEVIEQQEAARKSASIADVRIILHLLTAFHVTRLQKWVDQELESQGRSRSRARES